MRFLVPLFVVLAVAAFHSALSASLESAVKEEDTTQNDELTQLQKIDKIEFEAAQKAKAAQMNVTEDQNEDTRYLEAVKDGSEEHSEDEGKSESKGLWKTCHSRCFYVLWFSLGSFHFLFPFYAALAKCQFRRVKIGVIYARGFLFCGVGGILCRLGSVKN
ncbi:hypothetical protein GOODEAATRI_017641 [Goodea atripinnis]|uniref:Uncharacterized protein n=1 Tax=Goodea atripinnis TaxID=208336 RepID=A0ABV0PEX1_9TELE